MSCCKTLESVNYPRLAGGLEGFITTLAHRLTKEGLITQNQYEDMDKFFMQNLQQLKEKYYDKEITEI